jgi:hypothetical protein
VRFSEPAVPIVILGEKTMKIRLLLSLAGLALGFALPTFAQQTNAPAPGVTKEINLSGTHYWSGTPKVFQIDPDRIILEMEIYGVRVNDSNDGPFNGASVYIATLHYENRAYNKTGNPVDAAVASRNYEVWTDKEGDKVIWELTDDASGKPSGAARLIDGTGKYTGWQGTMEYTLQFPKPFPEGTARRICREVVKIVAPAETK